jgi:hypothetical protein
VDCWIGIVQEVDRRVVRVAGRLSVAQVPELFMACVGEGAPVEVDLTDLISADAAGCEALRRIRDAGAILTGAPGFIRLRIDSLPAGPRRVPRPTRPD